MSLRRNPPGGLYYDEILNALARTAWALAWADWAEENGESLSGLDIVDAAPATPASAMEWGRAVLLATEELNGVSIDDVLRRAADADETEPDSGYAEDFGSDLAMMVMGHGVSWFDDHARFPLKKPDAWASSLDGETLDGEVWFGGEMRNNSRIAPARTRYVAIDPRTGLHLREATAAERRAYEAQRIAHPSGHPSFRRPIRRGDVLIDEDAGPGVWYGGAGF